MRSAGAVGATPAEAEAAYPTDALAEAPHRARPGHRCRRPGRRDLPVAVSTEGCTYSYDWVDNLGRRSPRELTPALISWSPASPSWSAITSFATDHHITGRATPAAERLFGVISLTYLGPEPRAVQDRLIIRLDVHRPTRLWEKARYRFLAWGDLIMMRKQLRTLKGLAEQQVTNSTPSRMTPEQLVSGLYERRYQARVDWPGLRRCCIAMPSWTCRQRPEHLTGRDEVMPCSGTTRNRGVNFACSSHRRRWQCSSGAAGRGVRCRVALRGLLGRTMGLLHRGVEYWVTVGGEEPPPDRRT